MPAPRNYWMIVLSPENFSILRKNGFRLMGLARSLKKRAQRMERGDRVLFYVLYIDARDVSPRLEYVRKWTPERWPLAFQGPLHLIPKIDFQMLEDEMRKISRRRRAPLIKSA